MFETPTIDINEIRSTLTEAGNTAAGFAVLAAKRANDYRLDATSRYSTQIDEFRKQALIVVNRVESVRADLEAAVEPTLAKVIDRLPAPAAKVASQAQDAVKTLQVKAHDMVVEALTAEVPVAKTTATKAPAAKPAATKARAAKPASKTQPAKVAKPAARTSAKSATPVATKPAKAIKNAKATTKPAAKTSRSTKAKNA